MDRLRSWGILACMTPITILLGSLASFSVILPNRAAIIHSISRLWSRCWCVLVGVKLHVRGKENLPQSPFIIVSNHQSHIDIPALFLAIDRPIIFLAKKSLFKIPFFGWFIRIVGHIPVDSTKMYQSGKSLSVAADRLKKGYGNLLVFAEGHRSGGPNLQPFKSGAFRLGVQSGLPLVPVVVKGGYKIHMKGAGTLHPGVIEVIILPPIQTTGLSGENLEALKTLTYQAIEKDLA